MWKKSLTVLIAVSLPGSFLSGCASARDKQPPQPKPITQLPHCDHPLGTAALIEDAIPGIQDSGLSSPGPLLRLMLADSGCFQVVDRGPAMARIEKERALAANGALKSGSGIGGAQILAADYLITPNVVFSDKDNGGMLAGGVLKGLIGGVGVKRLRANTVLSITDTRSGLQLAIAQGQARKSDLTIGGGALSNLSGGLGLYESTDIGRIVAMAFTDAYARLVQQAEALPKPAAPETAARPDKAAEPPKPQKIPYHASIAISLRQAPGWDSPEVAKVPANADVAPTGGVDKDWWLVSVHGQVGWIYSQALKEGPGEPAPTQPVPAAAPAAPATPEPAAEPEPAHPDAASAPPPAEAPAAPAQ